MFRIARPARLALAAGTAAVLAVGLTSSAEAATGNIRYFRSTGEEARIDNPPDNVCINLRFRARLLANNTNRSVAYYYNANCSNLRGVLAPNRTVSYANPLSVRVLV
ncbi:hypothetical protein [Streptomyces rubradiris]|uniref:Peptidase inhibitor family I36 n=1 Tax=Streptomyces rubradiris TaxID=285531 RepID=A0ABQ3RQ76_STRRR|nr:hypothetical protein [Streptomyces rubradiris]GHH17425.1 hypothetical protein GCM10018792_48090 [Streptomyces rubradiris]GHI57997.1 hypothetical protein Srubr_78430 [Streptomyces rubradiris]